MLALSLAVLGLSAGAFAGVTPLQAEKLDHSHPDEDLSAPRPEQSDVPDLNTCKTESLYVWQRAEAGSTVVHPAMADFADGTFFAFRDPNFSALGQPGEEKIGESYGTCALLDSAKNTKYCTQTFIFTEGGQDVGTMSITGAAFDEKEGSAYINDITGGTSKYFGAKGAVEVTQVKLGKVWTYQFTYTTCTPTYV